MKKTISGALALAFAATAFAQQPAQQPSEQDMIGRMGALQSQRNEANDRLVMLAGKISELTSLLEAAQKTAQACAAPGATKGN